MNKELLNGQIAITEMRNPGMHIYAPGKMSSEETADHLVELLQAMYVEHGITKNKGKLVSEIEAGNVLTWFAKKDERFIATASLIRQDGNAWELGRAVSIERGTGVGKRVILEALKFHLEKHPDAALTAEVRGAAEYKGVPSGLATQNIFFGLVNDILSITPYAVVPLFAHGDPLRNEQFVLSASDVRSRKIISEMISEATNNRSTKGNVPPLHVVHTSPFRLVVPSGEGKNANDVSAESASFNGCTLFPIEATDKNMPLIGMLSANPNMVVCGVERTLGGEGKPVVLIATLGETTELAPTQIGDTLPEPMRADTQNIADKFNKIYAK
jgi:hypothetical protein